MNQLNIHISTYNDNTEIIGQPKKPVQYTFDLIRYENQCSMRCVCLVASKSEFHLWYLWPALNLCFVCQMKSLTWEKNNNKSRKFFLISVLIKANEKTSHLTHAGRSLAQSNYKVLFRLAFFFTSSSSASSSSFPY